MNFRSLRMRLALATFVGLLIFQLQGVSSIGPESTAGQFAQLTTAAAILSIRNNGPVSVNGAVVNNGATILSGSTIATGNRVAAHLSLGLRSSLDITPDTTLSVTFAANDSLKVDLVNGCARLHVRKGASGEIATPQAVAGRTDPNTGGTVRTCFPESLNVGTQAGADQVQIDGLFGLGKAAALAVIGGRVRAVEGVGPVKRGDNPGPSAP